MSSDGSESSSDSFQIPESILQRERELMERNKRFEDKMNALMRSTTLEVDENEKNIIKNDNKIQIRDTPSSAFDFIGSKKAKTNKMSPKNDLKKQTTTGNGPVINTPSYIPQEKDLPTARVVADNPRLIEVDVPQNVEAVPQVKYDPVPELRQAVHKIVEEIEVVTRQTSEARKYKNTLELNIANLQKELKKTQAENESVTLDIKNIGIQIEESKERITQVKQEIEAKRFDKIEKMQRQNEMEKTVSDLRVKLRKQQRLADQYEKQLKEMPSKDERLPYLEEQKKSKRQALEKEKKALNHLKQILSKSIKAIEYEQRLFEHIDNAKRKAIGPESLKKAISEIL